MNYNVPKLSVQIRYNVDSEHQNIKNISRIFIYFLFHFVYNCIYSFTIIAWREKLMIHFNELGIERNFKASRCLMTGSVKTQLQETFGVFPVAIGIKVY